LSKGAIRENVFPDNSDFKLQTSNFLPTMVFNRKQYSDETLTQLYLGILRPRIIEEKMLILLRQNKISKWFSGIGQEAVAVGLTMALHHDEYILPMHRNLGVFTSRNLPLEKLFCQWQGTPGGYTGGRDRSFHFGTNAHHIVGMISHLGPQNGVAAGIALASKLKKEKKVTEYLTETVERVKVIFMKH
jgi:2-oxoisovalerate dehydrogenase E1 component